MLYDDGRFYDTQADRDEEPPLETLTPGLEAIRTKRLRALEAMPPEPEHPREG